MALIERHNLVRTSATAAAVLAAEPAVALATSNGSSAVAPSLSAAPKSSPPVLVTHVLAHYVATAPSEQVPSSIRTETTRTLLNWVGCAVGGSQQGAPNQAVAALKPFSGPAQASLFGRKERLDAPHAALVNGISFHVLDYDDTLRITTCRPVRH